MRKAFVVIAAVLLVASTAYAQLPAEKTNELGAAGITDWNPGQNQGNGGPVFATLENGINLPDGPEDTATCQYDGGAINALPTVFGAIYGNRFSQGVGGVALGAITLNSFSLYFAEDSVADTGLFYQPASPGATANLINARASLNVNGLVNAGSSFSMLTTINVVPQSALGTTGMFSNTFYLGAWCLNANTSVPVDNEAIGLDTNANFNRGYTAVSGVGSVAVANSQGFNAVLRANITSAVTVPVELMAFDVED